MLTLDKLLDDIYFGFPNPVARGATFERLVQTFLRTDTQWSARFDEVWLWQEWADRPGPDRGIDLVARERDTGSLVAVQCKFYDPQSTLSRSDIDSFLAESGKQPFRGRILVSTTANWGRNAEDAIHDQQVPVQRIGLTDLLDSSIDWEQFDLAEPTVMSIKERKQLRTHQFAAVNAVRAGFTTRDRGKLVMACGTGKTFTALRIAEDLVPLGGNVLFLVPSIALLAQSMKEWATEAEHSLRTFAVCSDTKVGAASEDASAVDLPIPPTTDASRLAVSASDPTAGAGRLTVVFATYQSIDVVHRAQAQGLGKFDLVICDEAHRTTGATLAGNDESPFVRVHDANYLMAARRLYMTATPRIYDDTSKAKAGQSQAVLASMDDTAVFGPEMHRLGFGEAVSKDLLTDYKVLVLAVDEGHVNRTMQSALTDPNNSELQLDDVAKIIGCWNGLAKLGEAEHDFVGDPEPMRRAVAFSRSIKDSKKFAEKFQSIVTEYASAIGLSDDEVNAPGRINRILPAAVDHVDGTFNMVARNTLLSWLKEDTGDLENGGEARILSNARCLSEGVDVPALDAVLFLNPRKSVVDVVQSVGRVMRKAPGKKYGYIILPIVIPAGMRPEDALRDNERYAVVWEVLQALRAHDERFDAMVNKIELNKARDERINVIGVGGHEEGAGSSTSQGTQGVFDLSALGDFRDAMYAKVVQKVGTRRYWEETAAKVAGIAEKHRARLVGLLDAGHAAAEFDAYLTAIRANLNESISRNDAIDMLSQHLVTAPIFSALFADYQFATNNPVSQVMDATLQALEGTNLDAETAELDQFYESVRVRVAGIDNAVGKQTIIKDLYEKFFKIAFPKAADALGIVYTPVEIVDFILRSVDDLLRQEFGKGITDEGVDILDPFTGTGTFIVRLLQSGLIKPEDLARKYASELHANEMMLLAYYVAAINIESTFHDLLAEVSSGPDGGLAASDGYLPFEGIVLADTFQMHEDDDTLDVARVFAKNSDRAERQMGLDIRVIVGNPPYSVGQDSGNDNNQNHKYPTLDRSIEKTFAARSTATNKNSLYDSYIRAIRWAADRIGDSGIIGFVTNGGFLDANTSDGLRKTLADEFATIYIYNLRGNQRTAGELSRKEGGKIFGAGSRNTVCVTFLIKKPGHTGGAVVKYRDIGDYLTREQKLAIVNDATVGSIEWTDITPNDAGDWINQRSDEFDTYQAIGSKTQAGCLFTEFSAGLQTNRDAWVYNYSASAVSENVARMIDFYNTQVDDFETHLAANGITDPKTEVESFIDNDPTKISWARSLRQAVVRGTHLVHDERRVTVGSYRPFSRQNVYFQRLVNHEPGKMPSMFPTQNHPNYGIQIVSPGSDKPFSALAVGLLPDLSVWGSGPSQFFARWTYSPVDDTAPQAALASLDLFDALATDDAEATEAPSDSDDVVIAGYRRVDNITDTTLTQYRRWYGNALPIDATVAKDLIFAFVYGLLHSPDYRERFAADLKRTLPRIPRIESGDFAAFANVGQQLLDLHIGYEDATPYPLEMSGEASATSSCTDQHEVYRVEKLKWKNKADKSTIVYNPRITVRGIPDEAHRYMLGSRSALGWILDRYQVKTDKASGIVNDPNDWSREIGNPRYILDLIAKVTTVSVETVRIVESLPPLKIVTT
ncbi:DEAD/DEAH box helicase [Antribacter gilvus]|uniref:DEAD/DEAH box helicase n=1 Tax=Antribacter gilvus TaxID=2304675 RepID=UPI000F76FAC6|nr:type ISP restriction/modification enzyme [Antribacter gilvus]